MAESPRPTGRAVHDVTGRADVEALLRRFYARAMTDEVLRAPFAPLQRSGLDSHLDVMADFWQTVLFGAGLYHGSALRVHRHVHDRTPLGAGHFIRWLTLWTMTVDDMFCGTRAERAKTQAARIAWAMHSRLTGSRDPALDALVRR